MMLKSSFLVLLFCLSSSILLGQAKTITIHAKKILDGKGGTIENGTIVVEDSRIVRIDRNVKTATYDLGDHTVMPGGIDTHVHISWHFDKNGKSHDPEPKDEEPRGESTLYA